MRVENTNKQTFGLGKIETPNTALGKRIERLIPRLLPLGDDKTHLVISDHGNYQGIYFGRPCTPFKVLHAEESFYYQDVKTDSIPNDDEGVIALISSHLASAQSKFLDEYEKFSIGIKTELKRWIDGHFTS